MTQNPANFPHHIDPHNTTNKISSNGYSFDLSIRGSVISQKYILNHSVMPFSIRPSPFCGKGDEQLFMWLCQENFDGTAPPKPAFLIE